MAMLEKQRLTYLEALGIDSYVPHRLLPGAAPSRLLSAEYFSAEAVVEGAAVSRSDIDTSLPAVDDSNLSSGQAGAGSLSAALDILNLTDITPAASSATTQPANEAIHQPAPVNTELDDKHHNGSDTVVASVPSPIKFSLNVWRIKGELLAIDSRQPGAALPTDRLLQNILRTVGYPMAQLPASELLRWPLFKDDTGVHNEDEARAMVQAYVSAQCAQSTTTAILLLGQDAVRFSLSIDDEIGAYFAQHKGTCIAQPQWNTTVLVAPSLIDMLQEPVQKAITWQALQSLCRDSDE